MGDVQYDMTLRGGEGDCLLSDDKANVIELT